MTPTAERFRFARFELHPAERRLLADGQIAALGARAFDVLMALVERRGRVVGKDELLDAVWPGLVVEESNLAVHVSTLRKLLGAEIIATVPGRGYQFTATLQPLAPRTATPPPTSGAAPVSSTRMLGRDAELGALAELLATQRLVTVVGPGGIGKTRLALGWCEGPGRAGRIAWVDLAGIAEASRLPTQVHGAVADEAQGGITTAALGATLAPLTLTIVLDNAEHLAADVAALARALLDAAPQLRLLVTSQVPLRMAAEQAFRLGTLSLPEGPVQRVTPVQALAHGAVQLFVARARAADPLFELAPGNVAAVVEICQRLDGLPLALELAAARVPTLGVTALAAALDQRLRVLGDEQRSAPARQRTLRAALEWSHGLLDLRAQRLFRHLAVFAGSFGLDAARAVAGDDDPSQALDPWSVMVTLGRLVDDSLVAREAGEPPRYRLLESARLFAQEQLERSGDAAAVRRRHLAWCAAFVGEACGGEAPDAAGAARIAAEYPNLRAALEHSLGRSGGDRAAGVALAVALTPYWQRLDADDERRRWLDPAAGTAALAPQGTDPVARLLERLQADGLIPGAAGALDPQALIALARRLRADEVQTVDGALKEIERAVDIASRVLAGSADGEAATDAFVGDVLARVADHTRVGDFDHAADALDDALAELERRDAERRVALLRSRRALLEAGVQQDLLRRDAFAVARRIEAIAALDAPEQPTRSPLYRAREAQMLEEGDVQGVNLSAAVAVELIRRRLAAVDDPAGRRAAKRELANALVRQSRREPGGDELHEAVRLGREALDGLDADTSPVEWAESQHGLARALWRLGENERSPERLEEGVRCCRAALEQRQRATHPLEWAETQHLLGTLLRQLGARDAGSERLYAAEQALREALKERTRSRMPLEWARTQALLGITLSELARREGGLARHHQAAQAIRNALLELTRERSPLEWAAQQNCLAIELAAIGEAEGGIETLQAAVDAYREALRELSRERTPAGWAAAQHNLGGALRLLGEREAGTQSLREAVLAFREALREHTRERAPRHWAATKNDLGLAWLAIGRRESGTASLEWAVDSLREALLERPRDPAPVDWANSSLDLGRALLALGERTDSAEAVAEAVATIEVAMEVLTSDSMPDGHADAQGLLAQARRWLDAHPVLRPRASPS